MDPITLVTAGIALLPKLPALWGTIAGMFGKKVPESVDAAGKLAGEVLGAIQSGQISPEVQAQLEQAMMKHKEVIAELALKEKALSIDAEKNAQDALTERHKADMGSDSWLSKNVRPICLLAVTGILAIATFVPPDYIGWQRYQALQDLCIWIYGYYFVGRSVEKGPITAAFGAFRAGTDLKSVPK